MIRVYFDWNVFTSLKAPKSKEFVKLKSLISGNDGNFLFPFSSAHLADLANSRVEGSVIDEYTRLDLVNIDEISQKQYLQWDETDKLTKPYIASSSDVYSSRLKINTTLNSMSFEKKVLLKCLKLPPS